MSWSKPLTAQSDLRKIARSGISPSTSSAAFDLTQLAM
jgi:hypothetical protein